MSNNSASDSFRPVILSGYSSQNNARRLAEHLGAEVIPTDYIIHNNGEIKPTLDRNANLRNADVIILASASGIPDRNINETKFLQQLARDGKAGSITTVLPYQFYGRQDSNFSERAPIGLSITLSELGQRTDKLFIFDPHNLSGTALALQGQKVDYEALHFGYIFAQQALALINAKAITRRNTVVMGLDHGGAQRLTEGFLECFRQHTGLDVPPAKALPHLEKIRQKGSSKPTFTGRIINDPDVRSKDIIIIEDMVDSGGTAIEGPRLLKEMGARSVTIFATNGLFSPLRHESATRPAAAIEKIDASAADGKGVDALFVLGTFDHALTDPAIAEAIKKSPIVHELDAMLFTAEIIKAAFNPDLNTNSISRRLAGDADLLPKRRIFQRVKLKPGNRLIPA